MSQDTDYDVIVVGAGPGGIQATISLQSDGTNTLMLDKRAIGGQAGESALIENLIGFAHGVSGKQLADAGIIQVQKFGAQFLVPYEVQRIYPCEDGTFVVFGEDRTKHTCKSVILAPGVQYRRHEAVNISAYINRGVNYGSPLLEPGRWQGKRVAVIGGANSAAQAACFLATRCAPCEVHMIVRAPKLDQGMSTYMAEDIRNLENITVHLETDVVEVFGDATGFKGVVVKCGDKDERLEFDHMQVLIGATPHTAWLDQTVALDDRGFIYTDQEIPVGRWTRTDRAPFTYETSVPGIFAIGDAELTSVKRASAAIGAGSAVTPSVRKYLAELRERAKSPALKAAS